MIMSICIAAIDEAGAKKSNGGAPVLQRRFFRNSVPSQDDVFFTEMIGHGRSFVRTDRSAQPRINPNSKSEHIAR